MTSPLFSRIASWIRHLNFDSPGGITAQPEAATPRWLFCTFIVLALIRVWFGSGHPLMAITYNIHDDRLFVDSAQSILAGKWLGPYNDRLLHKGPFFPLWLAATSFLGVPLFLAESLLYSAACVIFVIGLRPVFRRTPEYIWPFVCALVLFSPMPFAAQGTATRVLREGLYPALVALVIATGVGLFARAERPPATLALWATAMGLSLSAVWLTREEGVWIQPFVVSAVALTALRTSRLSKPSSARLVFSVAVRDLGCRAIHSLVG